MYTVTITFTGVTSDAVRQGMQIPATFDPNNSYIDSASYVGTVYDTNVPGFGPATALSDYVNANTMAPNVYAQFHAAEVAESKSISFSIDDPYMATYYNELNGKIAGFTVEVDAAAESDVRPSDMGGEG